MHSVGQVRDEYGWHKTVYCRAYQYDTTTQRAIIKFKRSNSLLLSRVVLFSRSFLVTIIRNIYTRIIINYKIYMFYARIHTYTHVLFSFQSLLYRVQTIVARTQLARARILHSRYTLHTRANAHTCIIQLGHVYLYTHRHYCVHDRDMNISCGCWNNIMHS